MAWVEGIHSADGRRNWSTLVQRAHGERIFEGVGYVRKPLVRSIGGREGEPFA